MTIDQLQPLHLIALAFGEFLFPVTLLSALDLVATFRDLRSKSHLWSRYTTVLTLSWMAWMDWKMGLVAYILFFLGVLVVAAIKDDVEWVEVGSQIVGTPILLLLFSILSIWVPHVWAWPLLALLIGIPVVIALLVLSTSFRVGVMATLGVLTVLGACHGAERLIAHFDHPASVAAMPCPSAAQDAINRHSNFYFCQR